MVCVCLCSVVLIMCAHIVVYIVRRFKEIEGNISAIVNLVSRVSIQML